MKNYLLFLLITLLTLSIKAQTTTASTSNKGIRYELRHQKRLIDDEPPFKSISIPNNKATSTILLGSSYNIFSIVGDRQNQVVYDSTVNTIAFVHRHNNGLLPSTPNTSGIISFDYSTDGGSTWTVNPFDITPSLGGGDGNRYPNIAIYNPSGNTDTNNIYIVATGPQLDNHSIGGSGWSKTFRASAKLDGTNLDEQYTSNTPPVDSYDWGAAGLFATSNGVLFDVSTTTNSIDPSGSGPNDTLVYHDYFINKGVFDTATKTVAWSLIKTITPNWVRYPQQSGDLTNLADLINMAWAPDGNIGYTVMMGAEENGLPKIPRPVVYKTINGGTTWDLLPSYHFSSNVFMRVYIPPSNTGDIRPYYGDFDIVVDRKGDLHIFSEVIAGYSGDPDSLSYIFSDPKKRFLMETITNNGTNWKVNFVDSIRVTDHLWGMAPDQLDISVRPQAARTNDGSKIFYSWLVNNPNVGSASREFPDITAIAKDVSTNLWSEIKNLSTDNNSEYNAYYQTMAVTVIETGIDNDYELPIVYAIPSNYTNTLSPVSYHFLKGVGFDDTEIINPFPINPVSVEETLLNEDDLNIYPNPTTGNINIELSTIQKFSYQIFNLIGKTVTNGQVNNNQTTLNLSSHPAGIYFVKISSTNGSVTKKIILTN